MAAQHTPMYMQDWIERLDAILQLNGRELLDHAGKISHDLAMEKSGMEYEKYKVAQVAAEKEESLNEIANDIQQYAKLQKPQQ